MPLFDINDKPTTEKSENVAIEKEIKLSTQFAIATIAICIISYIKLLIGKDPDYIKESFAGYLGQTFMEFLLYAFSMIIPLIVALFKYKSKAFYWHMMWRATWVVFILIQLFLLYGHFANK